VLTAASDSSSKQCTSTTQRGFQPGKILCNVEKPAHSLLYKLPELQRKLYTNGRQLRACTHTGLSAEFLPLPLARHFQSYRCVAGVEVHVFNIAGLKFGGRFSL
jgi:hypothetical protein